MSSHRSIVDFELAGRTLVRLVGPAPRDERDVGMRLGIAPRRTGEASAAAVAAGGADAPDLVLRFVAELPVLGRLRTVGRDDGAFTETQFVVMRGGRPVAIVPFESIGRAGTEIVVARGTGAPARLVSLLNLALLGGDRIAIHASAVVHRGVGIAACGWSGSGKTEVLLGLMARGASYVGDEWVLASPRDGMTGLPQPVRIQDWHLDQLPALRSRIGLRARARLATAGTVTGIGDAIARAPVGGVARVGRLAGRVAGRRHVDIHPVRLFGREAVASRAPLDRLILLETWPDDEIHVEPIDPLAVADRLALAHVHHRRELIALYWQARFAFPDQTSNMLERIEAVERERLRALFAERPAHRLSHPHRVSTAGLADAVERHLG